MTALALAPLSETVSIPCTRNADVPRHLGDERYASCEDSCWNYCWGYFYNGGVPEMNYYNPLCANVCCI